MLATVSILNVLLGVMLPGINEFLKNERLTTQINSLLSYLQYARSEAILRHEPVTVCASHDAESCSGAGREGWIVPVSNPDNTILRT